MMMLHYTMMAGTRYVSYFCIYNSFLYKSLKKEQAKTIDAKLLFGNYLYIH
jgi:hypothetical protein